MTRGLGSRQRRLLAAVRASDPAPLLVTGDRTATDSDRSALRRAARGLVLRGLARAIYLRTPNRRDAGGYCLALTLPDSAAPGEAYPRGAPPHITPPPIGMLTLSATLQALVLAHVTGLPVSRSTANRADRAYREQHAGE